jgi:hypothetical protein
VTPAIRLELHDGSFSQWITVREANIIVTVRKSGEYRKPPTRKKKSKNQHRQSITVRLFPPVESLRSFHEASPPSITRSDMLANVGITPGEGEADQAHVKRAQAKIEIHGEESPRHVEWCRRCGERRVPVGSGICAGCRVIETPHAANQDVNNPRGLAL